MKECWNGCGPVLPTPLVDLLNTGDCEKEEENEEANEPNFDGLIESDDVIFVLKRTLWYWQRSAGYFEYATRTCIVTSWMVF